MRGAQLRSVDAGRLAGGRLLGVRLQLRAGKVRPVTWGRLALALGRLPVGAGIDNGYAP